LVDLYAPPTSPAIVNSRLQQTDQKRNSKDTQDATGDDKSSADPHSGYDDGDSSAAGGMAD
jgi:hypothetical protein